MSRGNFTNSFINLTERGWAPTIDQEIKEWGCILGRVVKTSFAAPPQIRPWPPTRGRVK